MDGVHDMGGMDGFGKVEPEPNEPMFHTEWEARVLAMVRAMGAAGAFNIDTSRFYREMLPPHVYLSSSYYKKWFLGLEEMPRPEGLRERGGVWFRAGGPELHLGTDDAHAAVKRPHPGFRVESVMALEQLARRVEGAGFAVEWDERIEGRKRFYTRDPFGNRVELLADV